LFQAERPAQTGAQKFPEEQKKNLFNFSLFKEIVGTTT
jgi:hypothetical protein